MYATPIGMLSGDRGQAIVRVEQERLGNGMTKRKVKDSSPSQSVVVGAQ